eukprot:CAMPEP_0174303618 /NCGR_PEP_ID=MMETSP0809-20121228/60286_1 /TAXON_ID=73025 ORGANISM="Eutreptiella gymnastica-like, Strain CCMP1594" /NCGR_SAMPLE_ID=MMETSP0809 /ASSEMBLY_ACC=CAM_ASM_000658 /LENGTH=105 /DNA_ID=CAMNT_0015409675 /DNA_START=1040 /DNA_END=1357 /DNA_ORIENTATION=+
MSFKVGSSSQLSRKITPDPLYPPPHNSSPLRPLVRIWQLSISRRCALPGPLKCSGCPAWGGQIEPGRSASSCGARPSTRITSALQKCIAGYGKYRDGPWPKSLQG